MLLHDNSAYVALLNSKLLNSKHLAAHKKVQLSIKGNLIFLTGEKKELFYGLKHLLKFCQND